MKKQAKAEPAKKLPKKKGVMPTYKGKEAKMDACTRATKPNKILY